MGIVPRRVIVVYAAKVLGIVIATVLLAPAAAVVSSFAPRPGYRLSWLWARVNLGLCGVRVRTVRRDSLDREARYVFMANHASHFDVLAVMAALPDFQLRWVAKHELTRIPVFGWAIRRAGHVIIDRSNPEQAIASLRAVPARLGPGVCVVIFPEGTRSPVEGALLPLKKGGFVLALEAGMPIVPIAVRGSRRILAPHEWHVHAGEIEVVVGAPIAVVQRDRDAVAADVRAALAAELGHVPEPLRAAAHA